MSYFLSIKSQWHWPIYLLPAIRSLERRARYLFYCMFFCMLVFLSTISRQPTGLFKPNFACRRTLVPDVFLPFWGWRPPAGGKGGNEIFVTMGVNGEFLHFDGFWPISQQRVDASTPNFILYRDNVCQRAPLPLGFIGPWGRGNGDLKTQKMGVVSFVQRTATISVFLSVAKCSSVCRAQTCAHSGIKPSTLAKGFLQGGPKVQIFDHF